MPSGKEFVEYVLDQIDSDCQMTARAMFGGYTLYSRGKVVGLIGDDQVFIKKTKPGCEFAGAIAEASPYEGAKPALAIGDRFEDTEWISELIKRTEEVLPLPKRRKKKKKSNRQT